MTDITIKQKVEWLRKMRDSNDTEMQMAESLGYALAVDDLKTDIEIIDAILADYRKQSERDAQQSDEVK